MGDVGILAMLQGQDNWSEKRAAKARELQYAAIMNQMSERKLQEEHLAGQQMQDYMNTVGKLKLLDPAIERVRAVNEELTRPIEEGLRAAGGDVKKYMLSGGINQLQQYKDKLVNNPTVQKDLMSAFNYNKYNEDLRAGLVPRGNADEDFHNYSKGQSDYFGYQGGYKRPDLTNARKYFGETYGANKYAQQEVDPQTFYLYSLQEAKKENLSDADAHDFAMKSAQDYAMSLQKGSQPIMFKNEDPSIAIMNQAKANYYAGKTAGGAVNNGSTFYKTWINSLPGINYQIEPDHTERTTWNGEQAVIGHIPLALKQMNAVLGGHGLVYDKGKISNPEAVIQQNMLYTADGRKLDIGSLNPSQIEITPLPWLADVNGGASGDKASQGLINAVIQQESGGKPDIVSSKGAIGLMQLMPETAKELGVDPRDPKQNVAGGTKYLESLKKKFGNWADALAAYNWGQGNVSKWIEEGRPASKMPAETINYVNSLLPATQGQNHMKGMAFSIRIPESAAGSVKAGDEYLDGWFSHANIAGMKKDRHWWDENGYTLQVFMPASKSPGVMTQIEDAEGGLYKRQMEDFAGSMNMQGMDLQMMLQEMNDNYQNP